MNSIGSVLLRTSLAVLLVVALDLSAEEGGGGFDDQGINANDPALAAIRRLQESEELGIQLYRNGSYERAYEILSETARQGFKDSQHAMAMMYIRGEGVDKNPLIGTALFGLAAESGDRTLQRDYGKLLKSIPDKYRAVVEAQVAFYIE
ncbi:MAG: hypothetical protein O7H39_01605, partial [Gammaproteobacteria bacterium]|nr:hypothetical protein [Gammaproteobacteria bacterium]